jgi:hypothetical protein
MKTPYAQIQTFLELVRKINSYLTVLAKTDPTIAVGAQYVVTVAPQDHNICVVIAQNTEPTKSSKMPDFLANLLDGTDDDARRVEDSLRKWSDTLRNRITEIQADLHNKSVELAAALHNAEKYPTNPTFTCEECPYKGSACSQCPESDSDGVEAIFRHYVGASGCRSGCLCKETTKAPSKASRPQTIRQKKTAPAVALEGHGKRRSPYLTPKPHLDPSGTKD